MTAAKSDPFLVAKRAVYGASQAARILWYTGHYFAGRRKMGPVTDPGVAPAADEFGPLDRKRLRESFRELFRADWRNIAAGEYRLPRDMTRAPSPAKLMALSRDYLQDTENVARRKHDRRHSEVFREPFKSKYPRYFLQNFHYQTDGWMSAQSADRYEMQVETLFTGSAAVMRRQALPAIRKAIGARDPASLTLVDLGCGAGSFLREVKHNWPGLNVIGLDLSPAYLGKAQSTFGDLKSARFVEANAEETGLAGASADIVTAVYLFHELPPAARRNVVREASRILKPGGAVIQADTIQFGDEPGLDSLLENFPRAFHEPYYDGYCREDLAALFGAEGLQKSEQVVAFLTKITSFAKAA